MSRLGIRLFAALALLGLLSGPAVAGADKPLVIVGAQTKQLPSGDTLQTNASAAAGASINMPHGSAPTSPNNGDCWTTTSGLFCRINGTTVGPYTTGSGGGGTGGGALVANNNLSDVASAATSRTNLGAAASGATTSSGLTMATSRLLGRTTASTGAVEEISVGSGLTLSGGSLSASGASGSITGSGYTQNTGKLLGRSSASSGAIEELTVGSGLSLSGGTLSASGGTSVMSVKDALYKAMAEANLSLAGGGTKWDTRIDKGGFQIIVLAINSNSTTHVLGTSYTVPSGKTAFVVDILADERTTQNSNQGAYLYNVTQTTTRAAPYSNAITSGQNGVIRGLGSAAFNMKFNSSPVAFPATIGSAGDVLRAEAWGGDTNNRMVFTAYVLAIVDNTTHLLDPVT